MISATGAAQSLFVNPTGQERPVSLAAQETEEGSDGSGVAVEAAPRSDEEGGVSVNVGSRDNADAEVRGGRPGSIVDILA